MLLIVNPLQLFPQVNATYLDGFRATACCPMGGPRAIEKGKRMAESILERLDTHA